MKKTIILFALLILNIAFCYSQSFNFDPYRVPQLDTGSASPSNYIYFPPVNQVISTTNNGSIILNSSLNIIGSTIITDRDDRHIALHRNPQTEPSLTINKNHPNNIIISCNFAEQITTGGFVSDQSIFINHYFNDPSSNWVNTRYFPPVGTKPAGDPATASDALGNLYCSTIEPKAKNLFMDISADLGNNWPVQIDGGTGSTTGLGDFDKLMIAVDNLPSSPHVNNCYAAWLDIAQPYEFVQFNKRTFGAPFGTPVTLSQPGNRYGQGTNIKTGPYGEVYVCWADYGIITTAVNLPAHNIGFAKDLSLGGAAMATTYPNDLYYNGIRTHLGNRPPFNNTSVNDFPAMAVDRSCGSTSTYRGRIYITYAENLPPSQYHSRIIVQFSDDQGVTWTKGNSNLDGTIDVDGNQNWMPWISVDDASGNVYIAYLSALNAPVPDAGGDPLMGTFLTDVYLAVSEDGGNTFTNIKVNDNPINPRALSPTNQPFKEGYWGDYISVDAFGGKVYVAWMSNISLPKTYNIFCSTIDVTTPVEFNSQADLPINGPVLWTASPNSPTTILYEAVNTVTAAINQEQFSILSGADVTFRAGNSIHVLPGYNNANDFGAAMGSRTHFYIKDVSSCSIPFRRARPVNEDPEASIETESSIQAYPNPFVNIFELNYSVPQNQSVSIDLYNSFGQKVREIVSQLYHEEGKYNIKVNLPSLNSGIYYIVMQTNDQIYKSKVVKL